MVDWWSDNYDFNLLGREKRPAVLENATMHNGNIYYVF